MRRLSCLQVDVYAAEEHLRRLAGARDVIRDDGDVVTVVGDVPRLLVFAVGINCLFFCRFMTCTQFLVGGVVGRKRQELG